MAVSLFAQEAEAPPEKDIRPVRNTFESIWLGDNQTVEVPIKGTFEWDILHRFGSTKTNGFDDFWGLFASSNLRLGFNYVPVEKLQIGFGVTKENLLWDFNAKYAILRQGRSGGSPLTVTYFGNLAIDTRSEGKYFNYPEYEFSDRVSYFNQLMIARKITRSLSLQAAFNLSHFNYVGTGAYNDQNEWVNNQNTNHFSTTFLGRYKITEGLGVFASYDLPLTDHPITDPKPNLNLGIELVSSSHAFHIFVGNYYSIVPQVNNARNLNEDLLIGFNMTRLWNF
jgi:hypothetical protein